MDSHILKKILICDARSRVVTTLIQGPLSAVIALDYVTPEVTTYGT